MADAVILAGGSATRLDGVDKPALSIGRLTMLDRVLDALSAAETVVVVGPSRPVRQPVLWCIEQPPGGGPVAALAAGLALVHADVVFVVAADLPWIGPAVPRLLDALSTNTAAACAVLTSSGRRNYLAAVWRRDSLQTALDGLSDVRGAAARELYTTGKVVEVVDEDGAGQDCDTWADVQAARTRVASSQTQEGQAR